MEFSIFFPISFISIQNLKKNPFKWLLHGVSTWEAWYLCLFVNKTKYFSFYSAKIHYRAELQFQYWAELHFSMKISPTRKGIFQSNSIHFSNIIGISIKLLEAKTTSDGKSCNLNMTHNESWSRQNIVRYST